MRIQPAAKSEDVQLVQLGGLLQELLAVGTQTGVQHRLAPAQLEVKYALKRTGVPSQKEGATETALPHPAPKAAHTHSTVTDEESIYSVLNSRSTMLSLHELYESERGIFCCGNYLR